MNWYLWFIFVMHALATVAYYGFALKGDGLELKGGRNPVAYVLWAAVGLVLLFWTTGPLNHIGWLYVAYLVGSNAFFASYHKRTFHLSTGVCLLLGTVCAMWAVLIVTVGFGV